LPLRIADFGRLHRYEKSGALHGVTRVRSFSQDDAHIFCTHEQVQAEIEGFMMMLNEIYQTLGMSDYKVYFSTRPEKRAGSEELWNRAEAALEQALKNLKLDYILNPGDGAFYGPKLDISFVDALKRPWQLGTLQYDPNMPERFKLSYIGPDNTSHTPVMLHRAILGSLERFIGVYTEHCAGHFPLWMAPEQVRIINVVEKQAPFCEEILQLLKSHDVRAEFDRRNEKLGFKIREAQLSKVPYMVIVGDKELDTKTVSVRYRTGENFNNLSLDAFIDGLRMEIHQKKLTTYLKD
jgi:threonyl-tRNA synthetase